MDIEEICNLLGFDSYDGSESIGDINRYLITAVNEGLFVGVPKLLQAVTKLVNTRDIDSFVTEIDDGWFKKLSVVARFLIENEDEFASFTNPNTVASAMNDWMDNEASVLLEELNDD